MSTSRRNRLVIGGSSFAAGLALLVAPQLANAGSDRNVDQLTRLGAPKGKIASAQAGDRRRTPTQPSHVHAYQDATSDTGEASAVADAKVAVAPLLTDHRASMRLPDSRDLRRSIATEPSARGRRADQIGRTWTTGKAGEQAAEIERAVQMVADDPSYNAYTDNQFVVVDWQGVHVDGVNAAVQFTGYDRYLLASGWRDDPVRQWQVRLVAERGGWKLEEQASVPVTQGGPVNPGKRP